MVVGRLVVASLTFSDDLLILILAVLKPAGGSQSHITIVHLLVAEPGTILTPTSHSFISILIRTQFHDSNVSGVMHLERGVIGETVLLLNLVCVVLVVRISVGNRLVMS